MNFRPLAAAIRRLSLLACLSGAPILSTQAQQNGAGPCALVIGYKAEPQNRPALHRFLATEGVRRFEQLRQAGVFARYQLFFSTTANQNLNDLTVILQFDHFADVARWTKIETAAAGGLAVRDHEELPVPVQSDLADNFHSAAQPGRDPAHAVCVLIPYTVAIDMDKYRRYVDGYVVPQMDGWVKHGAMSAYAIYLNQNGAGSAWDSLLVLEYNGYEGLAQREVLKAKVREDLAANPVWKQWSMDKSHIRNEQRLTIAEPILLP